MSSLTRDQRLARQDRDQGDPDDEVFIATTENSASHQVYHDDKGCRHMRGQDGQTTTRRAAQIRWLAPCLNCVIETAGNGGSR